QQGSQYMNTMDSIGYLFLAELDSIPWAVDFDDSLKNFNSSNIRVEIYRDRRGKVVKRIDTTINVQLTNPRDLSKMINIAPNVPKQDIQNLNEQFNNLVQKVYSVNELFQDMFNLGKRTPITERLPVPLLDSLIGYELEEKGVEASYEFGVFSSGTNQIVIQKTGNHTEELLHESFAYNIYPNEMFMSPEYLMMYFPKKRQYLVQQMWGLVGGSVVLIIIIILSFYFTITTIFKQRKISEMKNDFINNMTHEFKTPIATVSLACQALSDKDIQKSEDLYGNYINIIDQENKRLGLMAEKILQTALIEKGELKLNYQEVDFHDIIEEAIKNIQMQIEIKDGAIYTLFGAMQSNIKGDRLHLTNVISNLLDNANKYTPRNPKIEIETINNNDGLILFINDNGIGISKSDQKKIFEKLYRVHTGDRHDVKGFGLGLSYVKFIVEKHGGTVGLESELNKGTKFKIFLPYDNSIKN
ncbi:MAG: HAMP domain-containing histidine kinase, partial [Bacteroidales bacterium]|nr:HAMP domain-containing histidine kinase [Bacteroidales bacterium]